MSGQVLFRELRAADPTAEEGNFFANGVWDEKALDFELESVACIINDWRNLSQCHARRAAPPCSCGNPCEFVVSAIIHTKLVSVATLRMKRQLNCQTRSNTPGPIFDVQI